MKLEENIVLDVSKGGMDKDSPYSITLRDDNYRMGSMTSRGDVSHIKRNDQVLLFVKEPKNVPFCLYHTDTKKITYSNMSDTRDKMRWWFFLLMLIPFSSMLLIENANDLLKSKTKMLQYEGTHVEFSLKVIAWLSILSLIISMFSLYGVMKGNYTEAAIIYSISTISNMLLGIIYNQVFALSYRKEMDKVRLLIANRYK